VNFYIGGRIGASIKEYVCKLAVNHIAKEGRKPGSYTWQRGGERRFQAGLESEVVTDP
jgi:NADH dehydrogenase